LANTDQYTNLIDGLRLCVNSVAKFGLPRTFLRAKIFGRIEKNQCTGAYIVTVVSGSDALQRFQRFALQRFQQCGALS
jgi:hypothetical protein